MKSVEGMILRAALIAVVAIAAGGLLTVAGGANAAKKNRVSGTLTVKTVGLPAGTPLQITVSGRKNTVRTLKSAGSKTFRGLPLGRYVIRSTATRLEGGEAAPEKTSLAVRLTKKAPKRLLKVKYRISSPSNPGTPSPGGSGGQTPGDTTPRLRFNLSDAEGVGIRASGSFGSSSSRSGISPRSVGDSDLAALRNGRLVDAVESSASPIEVDYLLVRADAVYLVFGEPISLETGQPAGEVPEGTPLCIFAKIAKSTEEISCVDNALSSIGGQLSWIGWLAPPPVQFGADGSIYYSGRIAGETLPVLRKKTPSGEITTLFSRDGLDNFVLLPSGKIAVRTCPGGTCGATPEHLMWIPSGDSGSFETIPTLGFLQYMVRFADNKLYFGNYNPNPGGGPWPGAPFYGIRGYDPDAEQFDSRSWVLAPWLTTGVGDSLFNPRQNISGSCIETDPNTGNPRLNPKRLPLCEGGAFQASAHLRSDGKDYLLVKTPPNWNRSPSSIVIEAYPNVRPIEFDELETVQFMTIVGNQMIGSGLNASGENVTARVNLNNSNDKSVLLGAGQEVSVLGLDADQSGNRVVFYGLDESTNKFVLGRVNLATGQVSKSPVDDPSFSLASQSFQSFE